MSNLILFGAGASAGSEPTGTPPLGVALFDSLARFNPPGWGAIPIDLARVFREDFERGTQRLSAELPNSLPPLQRAMAAYFYNFAPTAASLYFRMGHALRANRWQGAIATLNYERLLTIAFSASGNALSIGPPAAGQVELVVPHGNCVLFCEGARGLANAIQYNGVAVETNGPIVVVDEPRAFQQRIQGDAFPPVMSYFEPDKRTTAGANFIEGQRQRFSELVATAERVVVIGVQPRQQDGHVWDPLARTRARITYCSGAAAAAAYRVWGGLVGRDIGRDNILAGYWAPHFEETMAEAGIGTQ